MDAQLRWLEQTLDGPRDSSVWVVLYPDRVNIDECPDPEGGVALGCWAAPVVHTTFEAVAHELVHAYLSEVNEVVPTFLREGLAVALAGGVAWGDDYNKDDVLGYLLREFPPSEALYQTGGHFVRWLLGEYDAARTIELYRRLRPGMSQPELSEIFEIVLGVPLDELLPVYVASTKDYYPSTGPFACGLGEPLEWQDDRLLWEGEVACSDPRTIGRYLENGDYELWRRATIDIPTSGMYVLGSDSGKVTMTRCLQQPEDREVLEAVAGSVHEEWDSYLPLHRSNGAIGGIAGPRMLEAGVYDLWIGLEADAPTRTFSVRIRRE